MTSWSQTGLPSFRVSSGRKMEGESKRCRGRWNLANYKLVFRRNAKQAHLTEGQLADDAALPATRAEIAMSEFACTESDFRLNRNFTKMQIVAAGQKITDRSVCPDMIENVKEYSYLGSVVVS